MPERAFRLTEQLFRRKADVHSSLPVQRRPSLETPNWRAKMILRGVRAVSGETAPISLAAPVETAT